MAGQKLTTQLRRVSRAMLSSRRLILASVGMWMDMWMDESDHGGRGWNTNECRASHRRGLGDEVPVLGALGRYIPGCGWRSRIGSHRPLSSRRTLHATNQVLLSYLRTYLGRIRYQVSNVGADCFQIYYLLPIQCCYLCPL